MDVNVKSLGYISELRNNALHACNHNVLYSDVKHQSYVMGQYLNFQHSFWDVIQEVTYHCI